jgi:LysW-gamma-L-lysine carboxypeptidase
MNKSISLLKQMLEIYSPSRREKTLAHFLKDQLIALGFKNVRLDKVSNVFGEVGSGSPTILLCGHIDTVPGHRPVKIEGDNIFGRGAVDAKSSFAAMIISSSKLIGQITGGTIILAGVVGEEGKSRGIRQLLRNKLDVDYAIFGEPSGVNNITRGYKGKLGVKIICETETGHTSAPQFFNNAVEAAYELWSKIKTSSLEENKSHRSLYYSTTVCLTSIRGGGVSGMIPSLCMFDFEVRMPPPSSNCQKSINWLNSIIQRHKLKNPKVKLTMKIIDKVEPFIAKKDSPLIRILTQAIKDTVGGPVRLLKKTGTGDMNIFAPNVKKPTITYGPGDSHLSHTINEYVKISEYLASIEVYRKTTEKLLSNEKNFSFSS